MSENLYPRKKVTVAPRSQTNRNVLSARLNRSVDKSAERREDGRLRNYSFIPMTLVSREKKRGKLPSNNMVSAYPTQIL